MIKLVSIGFLNFVHISNSENISFSFLLSPPINICGIPTTCNILGMILVVHPSLSRNQD